MSRIAKTILIVACTIMFGATAFLGTLAVYPPRATAQDFGPWNTKSVAEASLIAGYAIGSPAFLPPGFEPASKIMISRVNRASSGSFVTVTRMWALKDDPSVYLELTQAPVSFKVGGGQPTEVNGELGQISLVRSKLHPEIAADFTLAWEQQGVTFALTGSLKGPLDESTIREVAASIRIQQLIHPGIRVSDGVLQSPFDTLIPLRKSGSDLTN